MMCISGWMYFVFCGKVAMTLNAEGESVLKHSEYIFLKFTSI